MRRTAHRPLLAGDDPDPESTIRRLVEQRYPIYAGADFTVRTNDRPKHLVVEEVIATLYRHFSDATRP